MDIKILEEIAEYMKKYPTDKETTEKIEELWQEIQEKKLQKEKETQKIQYEPCDWDAYIGTNSPIIKSSYGTMDTIISDNKFTWLQNKEMIYFALGNECKIALYDPGLKDIASKNEDAFSSPASSSVYITIPKKKIMRLGNIQHDFVLETESGETIKEAVQNSMEKNCRLEKIMIPIYNKPYKIDPLEQELLKILLEWFIKNHDIQAVKESYFQITEPSPIPVVFDMVFDTPKLSFEKMIQLAGTIEPLNISNPITIGRGYQKGEKISAVPVIYEGEFNGIQINEIFINTEEIAKKGTLRLDASIPLYDKQNINSIKAYITYLEQKYLPNLNFVKTILELQDRPELSSDDIRNLIEKLKSTAMILSKCVDMEKPTLDRINQLKQAMEIFYERVYNQPLFTQKEAKQYDQALQNYKQMKFFETYDNLKREKSRRKKQ